MQTTPVPSSSASGITLIEVLVVIGIVIVLTAAAFPVIRTGRAAADRASCLNNLRQIGTASNLYATDTNGQLPVTSHQRRRGGISWTLSLQPYLGGKTPFRCPSDPNPLRTSSYLINDFLTPNPAGAPDIDFSFVTRLQDASSLLLFAEASPEYTGTDHFHFSDYRGTAVPKEVFHAQVATRAHGDRANYLFADGHAESLTVRETESRLARTASPFLDPTLSP